MRILAHAHLRQRRFGLGQPEGHVHGAIQRDSGRQGGAGRRTTAGLAVQSAQPAVAVGYEWAHAEFLGQGLLVVGFGQRDLGGVGVGLDNAKLVQRECLLPPRPTRSGLPVDISQL